MVTSVLERKRLLRKKRKLRVRAGCFGSPDRPRVSVFRSNRYFYAQAIDDVSGCTLAVVDGCKEGLGNNATDVAKLGEIFASTLLSKGISVAVFDRNGYLYHSVMSSFVNSLRSMGVSL